MKVKRIFNLSGVVLLGLIMLLPFAFLIPQTVTSVNAEQSTGTWDTITFDSSAITYTLTGFGGAENSSVVVDPTDATNQVAKVVKSGTAETWAGTTVSTEPNLAIPVLPFTASDTKMTVRVWSPDADITVRLKVEDAADNSKFVEVDATTTVANDWETLTFDFASPAGGTLNLETTYNKASIFFNFGVNGATAGEKTYYFDDVAFVSGTTPPPLEGFPVVADFEDGLPADWFDFGGEFPIREIVDVDGNKVLSVTFAVSSYGGFGANMSEARGQRDWTGYNAVQFDFTGTNSGTTYNFQIQDAAGGGTVERWVATFVDDSTETKTVTLLFTDFVWNGFQEDGAVDDGLQVTDMAAWLFDLPQTSGTFQVDNVEVVNQTSPVVKFDSATYQVHEGDTATITATLSSAMPEAVTVTYATSDGTGVADTDYISTTGQLVFATGETSKEFSVTTIGNDIRDRDRTVILSLSDAVGVDLGNPSGATLTILDDEIDLPSGKSVILEDYETSAIVSGEDQFENVVGYEFFNSQNATVTIEITTTVPAPVPGSETGNKVLREDLVVGNGGFSGFIYKFPNDTLDEWVTQDWQSYTGISFWLYGNNSGGVIFIDILDNRKPDSTEDDAGRFSIDIADNFSGWRYFSFTWDQFRQKGVGNGAPTDGFTLDEIHGFAFGGYGAQPMDGAYFLDDIVLTQRVNMIDDFEVDSLPSGADANSIPVGYIGDAGSGGAIEFGLTTTPTVQISGAPDSNTVLELDMTLPQNAYAFYLNAFTNDAADEWVPVRWESYEGVCFWLYGNNTGGILFLDILDNRNPGSTTDDAERYSVDITDDFSGWQFFEFTWDELSRKEVGNSAPNDGLNLLEVHGYAIGGYGSVDMGQNTYYLDDFAVWGDNGADRPLTAAFERNRYDVPEGDEAALTVELSRVSAKPVTVTFGTAESFAIPDRDFVAIDSAELVIPAGETTAELNVQTLDDVKADGNNNLVVVLYAAENADIGFQRQAVLDIIDDDPFDPYLLHDFEGFHSFDAYGNVAVTITEIADTETISMPHQGAYEQVLEVAFDTTTRGTTAAGLDEIFSEPQDLSSQTGMSFWYYGENTGLTTTLVLYDNELTSTATSDASDWSLVWADEFDDAAGTAPNPNYWTYELGDGSLNGIPGWGNDEFQYYTDDPANVSMDGAGNLAITLLELDSDTDLVCYYGPCRYTSARILTQGRAEFEYGRLEARVKVPESQESGLWPAFWTLGNDIGEVGWPATGEIDIMEYVSRIPNEIFGTIHGPGYSGGQAFGDIVDLGEPVANDYHTYAIEWSPDEIRWYFDGQGIGQGNNYHNAEPSDVAPNDWAFNDDPFFMLLNMAIGGNFGGAVSDQIAFPQTMLVDYVHVYQRENTAEKFEAEFVDNFDGWQLVQVPFTSMARSATQHADAPDDGLTLTSVTGYGIEFADNAADSFMIDQVRVYVEDNDGIDDFVELGAPNGGDGNNDGIPDGQQSDVASLPNEESGSFITLDGDGKDLTEVKSSPAPATLPDGVASLPLGVIDFKVNDVITGSIAVITLTVADTSVIVTDYYKQDSNGDWSAFTWNGTTGAKIVGNTIVLYLQDGGRGDADGQANGVIVDPGAPTFTYRYFFPILFQNYTPNP